MCERESKPEPIILMSEMEEIKKKQKNKNYY